MKCWILFYHNKIHFFTTVSTQIDLILDLRRLAAAEMDTEVAGNTVPPRSGVYESLSL